MTRTGLVPVLPAALAVAVFQIAPAPPAVAGELLQLDAARQGRAGIVVRPVLSRTFGAGSRVFGEIVREPGTTVTVKTPVHGRVIELHVAPGDSVEAGEPLLVLHSHELHAIEGEALRMRGELRLDESKLEAGRELFAVEGISRVELTRREQQATATRIVFEEAHHELLDMGYTDDEVEAVLRRGSPSGRLTVRSPLAGVVLEAAVQRHEWIEGFQSLMRIGDPSRVELRLQVPPSLGHLVRPGDAVDFAPVGHPELGGRARVATRIPHVDPATRTLAVRARILEAATAMLPGMYVEGVLVHGESREALSVPESAVIRIGSADYVFVRRDAGSYEAVPVRLGQFNGSRYEVVDGLRAEEQVVVEGVFFLKSALVRGEGS